jgi:hypothetical protein
MILTSYRLPVLGYSLPAAGYPLPANGYHLPATGNPKNSVLAVEKSYVINLLLFEDVLVIGNTCQTFYTV